ncbi:MAG: hypothetical protein H7833_18045 [Magnetococcus sp. DMHC-1]|nr:hypothetical protein [Magnetococcales bacterium]
MVPPKARADALTRLVIIAELRKLELVVIKEANEMAITFDVMENDVLREIFLKTQQESEKRGEKSWKTNSVFYPMKLETKSSRQDAPPRKSGAFMC